jgi:hypothetical protein
VGGQEQWVGGKTAGGNVGGRESGGLESRRTHRGRAGRAPGAVVVPVVVAAARCVLVDRAVARVAHRRREAVRARGVADHPVRPHLVPADPRGRLRDGVRPLPGDRPARAAVAPKVKFTLYRGLTQNLQVDPAVSLKIPLRTLEVTQILGQLCEFQVPGAGVTTQRGGG